MIIHILSAMLNAVPVEKDLRRKPTTSISRFINCIYIRFDLYFVRISARAIPSRRRFLHSLITRYFGKAALRHFKCAPTDDTCNANKSWGAGRHPNMLGYVRTLLSTVF